MTKQAVCKNEFSLENDSNASIYGVITVLTALVSFFLFSQNNNHIQSVSKNKIDSTSQANYVTSQFSTSLAQNPPSFSSEYSDKNNNLNHTEHADLFSINQNNIEAFDLDVLERRLVSRLSKDPATVDLIPGLRNYLLDLQENNLSPFEIRRLVGEWLLANINNSESRSHLEQLFSLASENSSSKIKFKVENLPKDEIERFSSVLNLTGKQTGLVAKALEDSKNNFNRRIQEIFGERRTLDSQERNLLIQEFQKSRAKFETQLEAIVSPEQFANYRRMRDLSAFSKIVH